MTLAATDRQNAASLNGSPVSRGRTSDVRSALHGQAARPPEAPLSAARSPATTLLGNWYATARFWRPQLALLVNERTLLPVLLLLAPAATLAERVAPAVAEVLRLHGVGPDFIDREVAAMAEVEIAKTTNRSVVGTMNEFVFEAEVYRDHRDITDPWRLAMRLSETPCGAISGNSAARLLVEMASADRH